MSAIKLSNFLNISPQNGLKLLKFVKNTNHLAILCNDYIISLNFYSPSTPVPESGPRGKDFLMEIYKSLSEFNVPTIRIRSGKPVYGYNPTSNEYKIWNTKGECLEFITGYRNTNIRTLNSRLDKDILYKGFYLQTKPFK